MATIGTIVLNLAAEGIEPGSYCYHKELLRSILEFYNMREEQLSDDIKKKLRSQTNNMSVKVTKLKLKNRKSLQELVFDTEKVRPFSSRTCLDA